jgi:HAD superfamily hydrolase (TIGR01484 family)
MLQELDGAVIEKRLLPSAFTQQLIEVCAQAGIELAIHIREDIYVEAITHNVSLLFDYDSPNLVEVDQWASISGLLPEAYKCLAIDRNDRQRLFELEKKVFAFAGESVEYCHTLVEMLEFMPAGVSKVSGIRSLAQARGIPMDTILAMGDGNNDIGMLREAGFAVAVANAPQAVRDVADWIVPPCAEGGPKRFLEHVLKNIR